MTTHRNEDPLCFEKTASRSRNGRIRLVLRRRDARRNGVPPCVSLFGGLCSIRRATSPCVRPSRPWRHNNLHNVSMIASSSVTSRLQAVSNRIGTAGRTVSIVSMVCKPELLKQACSSTVEMNKSSSGQNLTGIQIHCKKPSYVSSEYPYVIYFRTGGPQKLQNGRPPEAWAGKATRKTVIDPAARARCCEVPRCSAAASSHKSINITMT